MERENYLEDLQQRKPKKYVTVYTFCQYIERWKDLDSSQSLETVHLLFGVLRI